jgi:hypothetical protein
MAAQPKDITDMIQDAWTYVKDTLSVPHNQLILFSCLSAIFLALDTFALGQSGTIFFMRWLWGQLCAAKGFFVPPVPLGLTQIFLTVGLFTAVTSFAIPTLVGAPPSCKPTCNR